MDWFNFDVIHNLILKLLIWVPFYIIFVGVLWDIFHSFQHWGLIDILSSCLDHWKTENISLPIFFSFRNWYTFQINSAVMPGTKGQKALPLKFSSLQKKEGRECVFAIIQSRTVLEGLIRSAELWRRETNERAEENRSRPGCIIYLKP